MIFLGFALPGARRAFALTLACCFGFASVASAEPEAPTPSASESAAPSASPSAPAQSEEAIEQCVSAHTQGQELRKIGRLRESRELIRKCTQASCPSLVRSDCLRWVDELGLQIPSVVFVVTVRGENRADAKVFLNDELIFDGLPGRAVEINPGTHRFRFEVAGYDPIETEILLGEGEKFRTVSAAFDPVEGPVPSAKPVVEPQPQKEPEPLAPPPVTESPQRPVPLMTWVMGGVGLAAAANWATWGLIHQSTKKDYEDPVKGCAPNCDTKKLRQIGLIADVSLGVSVASFATAAILYVTRPTKPAPIQMGAMVLPDGGYVGVSVNSF
ncbi:MAG: hypothetical protein DIU78_018380 [Pseudomonadota bacterium]